MAARRVVVVGGGIAGTSAAWELAANNEVVLLEAETTLGVHATGRSAATLSETSGERVVCALARASRPALEHPAGDWCPVPLTSRRGLLWIGRSGDEPLLDRIAGIAASGVAPTAERVGPERAVQLVNSLRPEAVSAGAVWEPDALAIDVAALLQAYASGARRRGAELATGEPLTGLRPASGGGWIVTTPARRIECDTVVNAAGAWGDTIAELAGLTPLGLRPLRRTACLVPAPDEVRTWPLVMDVANRCYFEPESGGLLLSPADEHPSGAVDAVADELDVAWALEMLRETVELDVRSVRRAWAGLRTFTHDRVPAAGYEPGSDGFCWLVGQGGAGIKTAPALAAATAALIDGTPWPAALTELDVGPAALSPARFR